MRDRSGHTRVLHVVALLTADGRYGGPQRVALDLAREQRAQGFEVLVLAGGLKDSPFPTLNGVRTFRAIRLLPGLGYAGLLAPALLLWIVRHRNEFDVAHVHLARDLITLPAAALLKSFNRKYVVQTHGMVDRAGNALAKLLDFVAVRTVLKHASTVFPLTTTESEDIRSLAPDAHILLLDNGITLARPLELRRDKVTFLARLHPRKGGRIFAEAVKLIADQYPDVRFVVAGPDEGDLDNILAIRNSDGGDRLEIIGPVEAASVPELMATSCVYVLPAPREPFGMTVLEAMAEETPVVLHHSAELANRLDREGCFATFDGSAADLGAAISRLLGDRSLARHIGRAGREVAEDQFDLSVVVRTVTSGYS